MFLLDTNVYIDAFNDPAFGAEFRRFHQANLPRLVLSAVVAHEIPVGANDANRLRTLERGLLEPFRSRRRLHVPSMRTWELAAEIDRGLRRLGGFAGSLGTRAFANDMLIAATARELGATIVTRNLSDFRVIARVMPVRFEPPWP
jgi:predicted nucleic acid-binding protein